MNRLLVLVLLQLANYCPIELAQAETFPLHPQKDSALRGRGTKGQEGHSLIEIQTLMCHRQTADQNSQLKGEQNGAISNIQYGGLQNQIHFEKFSSDLVWMICQSYKLFGILFVKTKGYSLTGNCLLHLRIFLPPSSNGKGQIKHREDQL